MIDIAERQPDGWDEFEANRQKTAEAWLALHDAAIHQWDAWSKATPENARLRRLAERLSGLPEDQLETLCMGWLGAEAMVLGARSVFGGHQRMLVARSPNGQFMPAWAGWLQAAFEVDQALAGL